VLTLAEDSELLQSPQIKNKLFKAEDKTMIAISIMTTSMLSHNFTQRLSSRRRNTITITTGPSSSTSSSIPLTVNLLEEPNTAVMPREVAIMPHPTTDLEENLAIEVEEWVRMRVFMRGNKGLYRSSIGQ
jgi:hypothetical protein